MSPRLDILSVGEACPDVEFGSTARVAVPIVDRGSRVDRNRNLLRSHAGRDAAAHHHRPLAAHARLPPTYTLPHTLSLLWSASTSASMVLIPLTGRSTLALLMKTVHVGMEATFLFLISRAHGCFVFSNAVLVFMVYAILLVFTAPTCDESVWTAAGAGGTLDTLNFVSHLIVGLRQPDNGTLWLTIAAFGMALGVRGELHDHSEHARVEQGARRVPRFGDGVHARVRIHLRGARPTRAASHPVA